MSDTHTWFALLNLMGSQLLLSKSSRPTSSSSSPVAFSIATQPSAVSWALCAWDQSFQSSAYPKNVGTRPLRLVGVVVPTSALVCAAVADSVAAAVGEAVAGTAAVVVAAAAVAVYLSTLSAGTRSCLLLVVAVLCSHAIPSCYGIREDQ